MAPGLSGGQPVFIVRQSGVMHADPLPVNIMDGNIQTVQAL